METPPARERWSEINKLDRFGTFLQFIRVIQPVVTSSLQSSGNTFNVEDITKKHWSAEKRQLKVWGMRSDVKSNSLTRERL